MPLTCQAAISAQHLWPWIETAAISQAAGRFGSDLRACICVSRAVCAYETPSGQAARAVWCRGPAAAAHPQAELPALRGFTFLRLTPEMITPAYQGAWLRFMQVLFGRRCRMCKACQHIQPGLCMWQVMVSGSNRT